MTEKEKAIHLIRGFEIVISEETSDDNKIVKYSAKQCALVAVDEILLTLKSGVVYDLFNGVKTEYWKTVKSEIEKIN